MTPTPTGRLIPTEQGHDLVLTRTYRAPIEDVWASVTESERTARWYGSWEGEAGPGREVAVRLLFEEGQPTVTMTIDACAPPRHLALSSADESGNWRLELTLTEHGDRTELRFVHHLDADTAKQAGEVGPGWEYYLDALTAAREGGTLPVFEDYYPAQSEHFRAQLDA
ncbi:SRPBCC family protein [Nocardia puris]|uniref:Uncharacterized protein YndB with AHSA1/START domain n=1 Tax=Nocardia puris TaxID=208602 RepID=A0A366E4J9_9NOCA|nr:SRPBCC family protein [Nocardia puris]MBF6212855.1 SRPBCC family protein [Nocardia puris]MBF6367789.1 SRPBCC family protein [Nocardia puris]MBF6461441.1 SRPBCC family protein [Nocardia puris]RBO96318.1 uncharacterized protein YndB with AHSA1/START domain [Nocardia puris]